jgi:hypothetical protein
MHFEVSKGEYEEDIMKAEKHICALAEGKKIFKDVKDSIIT